MHKHKITILIFVLMLALNGCSTNSNNSEKNSSGNNYSENSSTESSSLENDSLENGSTKSSSTDSESIITQTSIDTSEMFTDRDFEIGYEENESAIINLNGDSAQCDSNAVQIVGNIITIKDEGTYILSGDLNGGMIIVEADNSDKLQIVLNGVNISSDTSAAIYVKEADKVFVTTAANTNNILTNGGSYVAIDDNNIDSVIFSKSDLTLNGAGSLVINSPAGHGIVSKDDLVIASGTYDITAVSHGIAGKDSVRIANGSFTIRSDKDGIHAENNDDASLGFLYISDGVFDIVAKGDGLSAGNYLQVEDGEYNLLTGGGIANSALENNELSSNMTSTDDSTSMKGMKATGELFINGGTFTIDSADDALHSNANLYVNNGSFHISTLDDGLHADSKLVIASGNIQITESYEGLEGQSIDILGGEINLVASDDGINAAGGNDQSGLVGAGGRGGDRFSSDANAYINISGGTVYVNAQGDGIDSNGSVTISGGAIYVSGPENSGNAALDYDADAMIAGGIFVASGTSQMAQNFGTSSTQGAMLVSVGSQSGGSIIKLTDSSGKELVSWIADKAFDSVIISCPEITEGAVYSLTAGSFETEITMDTLIYGSGSTGGMGGHSGNKGNRQPGGRQ